MTLNFVIIPQSDKYESDAYDFENKMKSACYNSLNIEFDTNYSESLTARVAKYKNMDKDIIVVGKNYESGQIDVRFSSSVFRTEPIDTADFIELIVSLEDTKNDEDIDDKNEEQNTSKEEDDKKDSGFCVIM